MHASAPLHLPSSQATASHHAVTRFGQAAPTSIPPVLLRLLSAWTW